MLPFQETFLSEMTKTPEIPDALMEQLLMDYKNPEDLLGPDGLMKELKGA